MKQVAAVRHRMVTPLSLLLLLVLTACNTSSQNTEQLGAQAVTLGKKGINIAPWFIWDIDNQNYSPQDLQYLKSFGFAFVRVPIEPVYFMKPDNTFGGKYLTKLETGINNLLAVGLKVIIDNHSFSSFPGTSQDFTEAVVCGGTPLSTFEKYLESQARYLQKFDRTKIVLEPLNEPHGPCDDTWNTVQKRLYNAARRGSSTLTLVLTGNAYSGFWGLNSLTPIADANVIYTVHYYDRLELTHQGADWIKDTPAYRALVNVPYPYTRRSLDSVLLSVTRNITRNPDITNKTQTKADAKRLLEGYYGLGNYPAYDRTVMQQQFDGVSAWLARYNIPSSRMFLGEFGVLKKERQPWGWTGSATTDRAAWLRDVRVIAESKGFAHAMWNYNDGGGFSMFNNSTGAPESQVVSALGLRMPQ
jgi:endoglucanase